MEVGAACARRAREGARIVADCAAIGRRHAEGPNAGWCRVEAVQNICSWPSRIPSREEGGGASRALPEGADAVMRPHALPGRCAVEHRRADGARRDVVTRAGQRGDAGHIGHAVGLHLERGEQAGTLATAAGFATCAGEDLAALAVRGSTAERAARGGARAPLADGRSEHREALQAIRTGVAVARVTRCHPVGPGADADLPVAADGVALAPIAAAGADLHVAAPRGALRARAFPAAAHSPARHGPGRACAS